MKPTKASPLMRREPFRSLLPPTRCPNLRKGLLHAFHASPAPPPASILAKKPFTRRWAVIVAAVIIAALVVGGAAYVLVTDSGPSARPDLLVNGAFETGSLQGWQTVPPYVPAVESSNVARGSSYAARFQTPTNDANVSSPCLTVGVGCNLLNTSTIYQNLNNLTVSETTGFSLAVYPAFQFPSAFQVALEFGLTPSAAGQAGYTDVLVYYLVLASPQQCSTYSSHLIESRPPGTTAATHCLSAQQGVWTLFDRDLASDLPSGISASQLDGSMLTLSVSFAGASPTDEAYVGSLYLG